jgi:hypothetical protein
VADGNAELIRTQRDLIALIQKEASRQALTNGEKNALALEAHVRTLNLLEHTTAAEG